MTLLLTGQALVTTRADTTPRISQVIGTLAGIVTELPAQAHGVLERRDPAAPIEDGR